MISGICVSAGWGAETKDTYGDAAIRVHDKHARNQVASVGGQIGRDGEAPVLDFLQQHANVFVVEWQPASKQSVEDDAARPNVGRRAVVAQTLPSARPRTRLAMTISGLA